MVILYLKKTIIQPLKFKITNSLFFVLITILSQSGHSSDVNLGLKYQEIFGLDPAMLSDTVETIYAPVILLGSKKGEILINVNIIMDIISVEKIALLNYLEPYLKSSILQRLEQHSGEFIPKSKIPKDIDIVLDENLAIAINLSPNTMKDIDPNLSFAKVKSRGVLPRSVLSSVNDFNIDLNQINGVKNHKASIDSTFRINRFLLSGSSQYRNKEATFFQDNWVTQFEDTDKSYYWGNIESPFFANLEAQKIHGIAIGNTDLRNNIIFESDSRYINLVHPADIKIYIDNTLYEEKSLESGRHRLNLPSQMDLFKVKVEITDIYGRYKEYDFSASGLLVEKIPVKGSYSYFLSLGDNENIQKQLYAGVGWGIDKKSKASSAIVHKNNSSALALQYYRILQDGGIRSTVTTSIDNNNVGHRLNTNMNLRISKDFSINTEYEHSNNLVLNSIPYSDTHSLQIGSGYNLFNKLFVYGSTKHHIDSKNNNFSLSARYQLNNNLDFGISHTNNFGSDEDTNISIKWRFPNSRHSVSSSYNVNTDLFEQSAHYQIDSDKSLALNYKNKDNNKELTYQHKGEIFDSRVKLSDSHNQKDWYQLETSFSIVSANDSISLVPSIGNYYGFGVIKADEDFIGTIGIDYQGKSCEMSASDQCVLLLNPEEEKEIEYQMLDIPVGVNIEPKELNILTPSRGGVKVLLTSHKKYFVEGRLVDENNKHVDLLIGIITDKDNKSIMSFTDDDGVFFAELAEGDYRYKVSGFQPVVFTVNKEGAEEGLINIGQITLLPEIEATK